MATYPYIVLKDGDSFSPLQGCKLVIIDHDALDPESALDIQEGRMADVIANGYAHAVAIHDLAKLLQYSPPIVKLTENRQK